MHLTNTEAFLEAAKNSQVGQTPDLGRWINDRIVAVVASPELGNATSMATGMSFLPPGTSTPSHDHAAEELAFILAGHGTVIVGDNSLAVSTGDLVRVEPWQPHRTVAADDTSLSVLWVYSPAGSENRWLSDEPREQVTANQEKQVDSYQMVDADRPWASLISYSRAVRRGNIIEIGGTSATLGSGEVVAPGDAYEQTRHVLGVIADALEELGATVDDVIRTRAYLTDISDWEAVGRAHGEVFQNRAPASTFVEVSRLLLDGLVVEIEATAVLAETDVP